jgi:hypothetical protein
VIATNQPFGMHRTCPLPPLCMLLAGTVDYKASCSRWYGLTVSIKTIEGHSRLCIGFLVRKMLWRQLVAQESSPREFW